MKTRYIILAFVVVIGHEIAAQGKLPTDATAHVKVTHLLNQSSILIYDSSYHFLIHGTPGNTHKKDSIESAIVLFYENPDKHRALFESEALFALHKNAQKEVYRPKRDGDVYIQFASRLSFIYEGVPTVFVKYYIRKASGQQAISHVFQLVNERWVIAGVPALSSYHELFRQLKPAVWVIMYDLKNGSAPPHQTVKEFLSRSKGEHGIPDLYNMQTVLHSWQTNQLTNKLTHIIDK